MKCWTIVHLGHSYSTDWRVRDVEQHDSVRAAKDSFWRDSENPMADESAEAWLFFYDPVEACYSDGVDAFGKEIDDDSPIYDVYPDRLLRVGPRGGIRMEYA